MQVGYSTAGLRRRHFRPRERQPAAGAAATGGTPLPLRRQCADIPVRRADNHFTEESPCL